MLSKYWQNFIVNSLCSNNYHNLASTFSEVEKWILAIFLQKLGLLWLTDPPGQPIRGLIFGRKWLEFISLSQIKGYYNFISQNLLVSDIPRSEIWDLQILSNIMQKLSLTRKRRIKAKWLWTCFLFWDNNFLVCKTLRGKIHR